MYAGSHPPPHPPRILLTSLPARDERIKGLNADVKGLQKQLQASELTLAEQKAAASDLSNEEIDQLRDKIEQLNRLLAKQKAELASLRENEKQSQLAIGKMQTLLQEQ